MFFGKFTIEVDKVYLKHLPQSGMFIGHSVVVGKVYIGDFRKTARYQSVNKGAYDKAYNACSDEMSHRKREAYAKNQSLEQKKSRFVQSYYAEVRAVWNGNEWQYTEVMDRDLTTNADGILITGKVIEIADDPFKW